jgi:hypothetical protein
MSWIDKVNSDFTIITGDKKSYKVNWINATKMKEYFISEFTFPDLAGSKVDRGQPKGRRYNLEIFLQGEENIETATQFEISADVLLPWTILHPLYGNILVQPVSLSFDNSQMNVTKITGQVIETIAIENPLTTANPVDQIGIQKEALDENFATTFTKTPTPVDIETMKTTNKRLYKTTVPIIQIPDEVQAYFNLFNVANSAINNAAQSPVVAMRLAISVISAPASLTVNTKTRVSSLSGQFDSLRSNIKPKDTTAVIPVSTKQIYQSQGGSLISSMSVAASTPLVNDYVSMIDVIEIIELLLQKYNQYILDLDSIQSLNGGAVDSFIPDAQSLTQLNLLFNNVISNLFLIGLSSSQQRTIVLDKDTNIIVLTHMLYGLDKFDNNINILMANNGWGLNQIIQIRKNTPVVYYVK